MLQFWEKCPNIETPFNCEGTSEEYKDDLSNAKILNPLTNQISVNAAKDGFRVGRAIRETKDI